MRRCKYEFKDITLQSHPTAGNWIDAIVTAYGKEAMHISIIYDERRIQTRTSYKITKYSFSGQYKDSRFIMSDDVLCDVQAKFTQYLLNNHKDLMDQLC